MNLCKIFANKKFVCNLNRKNFFSDQQQQKTVSEKSHFLVKEIRTTTTTFKNIVYNTQQFSEIVRALTSERKSILEANKYKSRLNSKFLKKFYVFHIFLEKLIKAKS